MARYKSLHEALNAFEEIQDAEERAARKAKGKAKYLRRLKNHKR